MKEFDNVVLKCGMTKKVSGCYQPKGWVWFTDGTGCPASEIKEVIDK